MRQQCVKAPQCSGWILPLCDTGWATHSRGPANYRDLSCVKVSRTSPTAYTGAGRRAVWGKIQSQIIGSNQHPAECNDGPHPVPSPALGHTNSVFADILRVFTKCSPQHHRSPPCSIVQTLAAATLSGNF